MFVSLPVPDAVANVPPDIVLPVLSRKAYPILFSKSNGGDAIAVKSIDKDSVVPGNGSASAVATEDGVLTLN